MREGDFWVDGEGKGVILDLLDAGCSPRKLQRAIIVRINHENYICIVY